MTDLLKKDPLLYLPLIMLFLVAICGIWLYHLETTYIPEKKFGVVTKIYVANDGDEHYSDYFCVLNNTQTFEISKNDFDLINNNDWIELESSFNGVFKLIKLNNLEIG